ncbi:LAMI_0G04544g1_1 [Lachancea mirantina]|uniref:LAMI_0G04544g1_1 n=1 Tax=Lachancea mirantina TaxID=1230905 RepID=A0A1G4K8M2_9SACH|nr:LAMI_0G04544g1_1 [Lachancea mirantina]
MPIKHMPIQPNLAPLCAGGPNNVTIAPNLKNGSRDGKRRTSSGIVIRTSKQWVLPPRPKPGRKPTATTPVRGTGGVASSGSGNVVTNGNGLASGTSANLTTSHSSQGSQGAASACASKSTTPGVVTPGVTTTSPVIVSTSPATKRDLEPQELHKVDDKMQGVVPAAMTVTPTVSAVSAVLGTTVADVKAKKAAKKPSKTVLKKEIQQLKLENYKLKQDLSQLVGTLQELKQKWTLKSAASVSETPADIKMQPTAQLPSPETKKRSFLDSSDSCYSTDAFLKFEDEDDDDCRHSGVISTVSMRQAHSFSSVYSTRTTLTDDEDTGFSSSTPSSLFSAGLQRSLTNNSFAGSTSHHAGHSSGISPMGTTCLKPYSSAADAMKFLDDYEFNEFYGKHKQTLENDTVDNVSGDTHSETPPHLEKPANVAPTLSASAVLNGTLLHHPADLHLDVIKEEDFGFNFERNFNEDDLSILNFLESHVGGVNQAVRDQSEKKSEVTAVTDNQPSWFVKQEDASPTAIFEGLKSDSENTKTELYMPPSLEELMDEQDLDRSEKFFDSGLRNETDLNVLEIGSFEAN